MVDLKRLNKHLGTNFKRLNGYINGLKFVIIKVDNFLIYFNKDLNKWTLIHNLNK